LSKGRAEAKARRLTGFAGPGHRAPLRRR